MGRIGKLAGLAAVGILLTTPAADAQQPRKVPRLGVLCPAACAGPSLEAFLQGLREHGYVEGRTLVIEYRAGEGKYDVLPGLAADLVRLKVDLILAIGNPTGLAAREATKTIPIVMALSGNADQLGLITSLARPEGNITGLTILHSDLEPKRLEMLKESVPGVSRVAVLSNPANPSHGPALKDIEAAAQALRLQVQSLMLRNPAEIDDAFAAMGKAHAGALLVQTDPMFDAHRGRIVALAGKGRLPTISMNRDFVVAGGLMAYGPNYPLMFRRAADFVDKILKGTRPGDLPVEQPMRFELSLNLKTAKALGVTFPPSILVRADQVIQ
jgi:putative ABC transport system substrate-binding protein